MGNRERKYKILLNQTSRFMPYTEGDTLEDVFDGLVLDESVDDALDTLYQVFNIEHPAGYRNRSLSVGDVVEIDGERFACEPFGWKKLENK